MVSTMDMPRHPNSAESRAFGETGEERRGFALMLVIGGSVAVSFAGVLARLMEGADALQINFFRGVGQFSFVLLVLLFSYRRGIVTGIRGIGRPGLLGAVCVCAASICYMEAMTTTTVANTLFVLAGIPLITAIMARVFLGEQLRRETVVAIAVASLGIGIMIGEGIGAGSAYGNLMALACATLFSTYTTIIRHNRARDMLPTVLLSSSMLAAVSFMLSGGDIAISRHDMALSLLWGVALIGVANWTFIIASRHLAAAEVTFFMLLEFAAGPMWVWIFIGEDASMPVLVGGGLVLASVAGRAWLQLSQGRRRRVPKVGTP